MDAAVVYQTVWGNTRAVADAVADGMRERLGVEVFDVAAAPPAHQLDVEILVVGGPTHGFGTSRPGPREDAARRDGPAVPTGIRDWLRESQPLRVRVATFDTQVRRPHLSGSASRRAARVLRRLGGELMAAPESFWIHGAQGPLEPGELARARAWGAELAGLLPQSAFAY